MTLSAAAIGEDLGANGRPLWKLTAYGPARGEPNLVAGKDVSQDELRVLAYQARSSGQDQQYVQHEQKLFGQAEAEYRRLAANSNAAMHQAIRNRDERKKQLQQQTQTQVGAGASAFGQPSAFGGTLAGSAFGAKPAAAGSAFGSTSAFGATPATGGASAFGQPSAFGSSTSAPATAIGSTGSAFAAANTGSAFGSSTTTPAFGTSSQPASAFGSSSTPTPTNAFGTHTTSAFGGNTASPFPTTSAFTGTTPAATNVDDPYKASVPKKEQLTAEVLALFQADRFEWGMVPLIEPPIDVR